MYIGVYPKHYLNINNKYNFAGKKRKLKSNKYGHLAASFADATSKALIADGANVDAYFKNAVENTKVIHKFAGGLTAIVTLFAVNLGSASRKYQLSKMNESVERDNLKV